MLPTAKILCANLSTAVTAGATVTATIDRLGFDYAQIVVQLEGTSATTAPTELKLAESDDNTTFTNITAFVGGGVGGFTIPTTIRTLGNALGPSIVLFNVDCRARGRYLKISHAAGGTNHVRHTTLLSRGDENPHTTGAALGSTTADLMVNG